MINEHENVWERTLAIVEASGWCIQAVDRGQDSNSPPYAYSVGMAKKGLPELLMTGVVPPLASHTLNQICFKMMDGKIRGFDEEKISGLTPITFKLRELDVKDVEKFLPICIRYGKHTGKPIQFMQVMFPDGNGRYPGDPDCSKKFYKVQSLVGLK
jgi:hypothetical protein